MSVCSRQGDRDAARSLRQCELATSGAHRGRDCTTASAAVQSHDSVHYEGHRSKQTSLDRLLRRHSA